MKKKHIELIDYLMNQTNDITSSILANELKMSKRTIKNYISEINLLSNQPLIISSKNGYRIIKDAAQSFLTEMEDALPQTSIERIYYIVKKMTIEHTARWNLFDLCEELYVSYSTLKADIAKMNKMFTEFQVDFICENDEILLIGDEKQKRKLISFVMQEETNSKFMNTDMMKESFRDIDIDKISEIILSTFHHYNYYINDFSLINLILHFAIIIDRIRDGEVIIIKECDYLIENATEKALVEELSEQLEASFHIQFNPNERFEIYMLFKTNANYSLPSNETTLKKLVGEDIFTFAKKIAEKMNDDYYVDLNNESFLTPFALHLKNLSLRVQNHTFTKNPMVEAIKHTCPTIYDMAISISLAFMNHYHMSIVEDEVAFLALHIGAEIERQKSNDSKIQTILVCPEYRHIAEQIYQRLLIDFSNQINIIATVSCEKDLDNTHADLIISTIKLEQSMCETVVIPPFVKGIDQRILFDAFERIRNNQKNLILRKNFHYFFSQDLFFPALENIERDAVIALLSKKMIAMHYVHDDFMENVLVRERAASTAFVNIAIPHPMEMNATKTCVGVALSKKGITWDEHTVHVVLCVAIHDTDKKTFHELYEALIVLFSHDSIIEATKNCASFDDFQQIIMNSHVYLQ